MRKHRISRNPEELANQLERAASSASLEPQWPVGSLPIADLTNMATELEASRLAVIDAENKISAARSQLKINMAAANALMRRVDLITSAIFGETAAEKLSYSLPPIDRDRNSPPAPELPESLSLRDGPIPGSLLFDWKIMRGAKYLVEAWDMNPDDPQATQLSLRLETKSRCVIDQLPIGTKVFVRVRAKAGKRMGPWSEAVGRFVN